MKKLYAVIAQMVEQWTENPCVGGSIPPHGKPKVSSGIQR